MTLLSNTAFPFELFAIPLSGLQFVLHPTPQQYSFKTKVQYFRLKRKDLKIKIANMSVMLNSFVNSELKKKYY